MRYAGTFAEWLNIDFANRYANPLYYNGTLYTEGNKIIINNIPVLDSTWAPRIEIDTVWDTIRAIDTVIYREAEDSTWRYYTSGRIRTLSIPDGITTIKPYALCGINFSNIDSVYIPASVTAIGEDNFDEGHVQRSVAYGGTLAGWCGIDFADFDANPVKYETPNLYINGTLISGALTIPNTVRRVGNYTFMYNSKITSLTIPNSVTQIGDFAFTASGIQSVSLGTGLTTIGKFAFGGCPNIDSIRVPNSVTSIDTAAFVYLPMLYYNGRATEQYPWGALCVNGYIDDSLYYTSPAKDTVTGHHRELVNANIPEGVVAIGDYAFVNFDMSHDDGNFAGSIRSLSLPSTLRSIGNRAFFQCYGLAGTLNLPDGLEHIGDGAFYDDTTLSGQLVLPQSLKTIGYNALSFCRFEGQLTIPSAIEEIGSYAFYGCTGLYGDITLPATLTKIGYSPFSGTQITSAVIAAKSNIIRNLGSRYLRSVNFIGGGTKINDNAFSGIDSLRTVSLPSTLDTIGNSAFSGCQKLQSVAIPNNVQYIGSSAFSNCKSLRGEVVIPSATTYLGANAFNECDAITSVVIGNGVDTLRRGTFTSCDSLASATIGSGVVHIDGTVFNNDALLSITLRPTTPPTLSNDYTAPFGTHPSGRIFYVPCSTITTSGRYTYCTYLEAWYSNSSFRSSSNFNFVGAKTDFVVESSDPRLGSVIITLMPTCSSSVARIVAIPTEWGRFVRWSDGATSNPRYIGNVGDNMTLTAIFTDTCTVTLLSADPTLGTVSGGGTHHMNTTATITARPIEHHHFVHWSDGNRDNPRQLLVSSDTTLTATFAIDTHRVDVVSSNLLHGGVTGTGDYVYGTPCTATATAYTGYRFISWSNGVTANPYTFAVVTDMELTAQFVAEGEAVYTITVVSNDPTKGTVSGGGPFAEGMQCTITANPFEGNYFARWNDGDTNATRTITVSADMTFTAYFAAEGDTVGDSVSIATVDLATAAIITTQAGRITISGIGNNTVAVYDIAGRRLFTATGDCTTSTLPTGIYMVRVGTLPARKVAVMRD